jgi:hypothetical protein
MILASSHFFLWGERKKQLHLVNHFVVIMMQMLPLSQVSPAAIALVAGAILVVVGGVAYAQGNSTLNLVGFFYGIPILLIGAALKSAELKPAPLLMPPTAEVLKLRHTQATPTLNQVRRDISRYRYGMSAHLEVALEKLGLGKVAEERPLLLGFYESVVEGRYSLVLRFQSPLVPVAVWQEKLEKIGRFFGPQVRAQVAEQGQGVVDLYLIKWEE